MTIPRTMPIVAAVMAALSLWAGDVSSLSQSRLTVAQINRQEVARRQELEGVSQQLIDQAAQALKAEKKPGEVSHFVLARDALVQAEMALQEASAGKPSVVEKLKLVRALLDITYEKWSNAMIERGDRLAERKQYDEALTAYQVALDIRPQLKDSIASRSRQIRARKEHEEFWRQVYDALN